jgi:hypothetical protein
MMDLLYTVSLRMQELSVYKNAFLCYPLPMRKRIGRPKLPPESRKTEVFSVRVTTSELAKIESSAKREGLDPREWGRKRLLSATE